MHWQTKPFNHLEIPNFLDNQTIANLLIALSKEEFFVKDADLFQFQQTNDLNNSQQEEIQNFIHYLKTEFKEQIEESLNIKLADKLDLSATIYQDTDYLLCHDDELDSRKIAFLFYLTDCKNGGALALIENKNNKPTTTTKRIQPEAGKLAAFEVSEISFHEVEEVQEDTQRIALGGWFHGV